MKIGFVCHEYPPAPHGGIGTAVRALAHGLADRGHAITVVGLYPRAIGHRPSAVGQDESLLRDGRWPIADGCFDGPVRVIRLRAPETPKVGWLLGRLRLRQCLRHLAEAGELDLVEAPDWQGSAWPPAGVVPTLVRFHGSTVTFDRLLGRRSPRLIRWLEQRGLAAADGHVAVSRFIARETAADFGLRGQAITVIPNGIEVKRFSLPAAGTREDGLVVSVGTVTEKKGVVELIRAWPSVVEKCAHARLAIVGQDGRHAASGRSLIAVLREMLPAAVAPSVTFTGAVPHDGVRAWLQRATLAVYPSFVESQGVVWLEAMAAGAPVLGSCRAGPGEEVIEHGVSGLLCDPSDPAGLAARIVECLEQPALRARLSAAARLRVEELFSTEVLVPRNEALYQRYLQAEREQTPCTCPN